MKKKKRKKMQRDRGRDWRRGEAKGGEGRERKGDKNTGRISEGWRNSNNISF